MPTITLGKDVTITGVANARSVTVNNSASEIDTTHFGSAGTRTYTKALIEQTVEVECVGDPGVGNGDTFTLSGTQTGDATYVVTNKARSEPIDGIVTYTLSGSRADEQD